MSKLFDAAKRTEKAFTANGAVTLPDSGNKLVDLFSMIGSSRGKDITLPFSKAFGNEEITRILTARILLWSRDIRGGAGERQTVRNLLPYLEGYDLDIAKLVANKLPEVGRWDDLFAFQSNEMVFYISIMIANALGKHKNSLCAKWMPRKPKTLTELKVRENIMRLFNLNKKSYRKMLVGLTDVVETKMCKKEWNEIDYNKIPSVASSKYIGAFMKNDENRYREYLSNLSKGTAKVNAGAIFPHDVVRGLKSNKTLANEQWKALPDYFDGSKENVLSVIDVSGSMYSRIPGSTVECIDIAVALGLYVCERTRGIFKDQFITFSENPTFQEVAGDLYQRINTVCRASWGYNTNLQRTFEMILRTVTDAGLGQEDMPTKILIFSDMEFDPTKHVCTNFQAIDRMYENYGFKRPDLIFWNLDARIGNSPVRFDQSGTAMVSGYSPSLMQSILSGNNVTPFQMMMDTIMNERYDLF